MHCCMMKETMLFKRLNIVLVESSTTTTTRCGSSVVSSTKQQHQLSRSYVNRYYNTGSNSPSTLNGYAHTNKHFNGSLLSLSLNRCNVGRYGTCHNTIQRQRMLLLSSSSSTSTKNDQENPFAQRRTSNVNEDDIPPITLDNTIRMKNAVLATILMSFCFGIAYYSMNAVGQAGGGRTNGGDTSNDPLSVLKAEAAIAQEKINQEQITTANTADMLEKFQKGEYDPDHISEDELLDDENYNKPKKPWWKFW
jgi:hypothetical protein